MHSAKELLQVIDQRITSYFSESKVLSRHSGIVVGKEGRNYQIKLLGEETVYTFPARSYIQAEKGDFVFVESKIGNLNNGIIVDFKRAGGDLDVATEDINFSLDLVWPVGSFYSTSDSEFNPNLKWGGVWELIQKDTTLRQGSLTHPLGTYYGESEHTLTASELPVVEGSFPVLVPTGHQNYAKGAAKGIEIPGIPDRDWPKEGDVLKHNGYGYSYSFGGNQPHNNMGPSLSVNIWHRVS